MFVEKIRSLIHARQLASYLRTSGWMRSFVEKSPQDELGHPIPWIPRPAYFLISQRIKPSFAVFEFGSGNSTLWFASQCKSVVSVEHDPAWHETMKHRVPSHAEVLLVELDDTNGYAESVKPHALDVDLILVDGRRRVECIKQILSCTLRESTVVILDNSERVEYSDGISMLTSCGYKHLEIQGLAPGHGVESSCSFFYKPSNVLDI